MEDDKELVRIMNVLSKGINQDKFNNANRGGCGVFALAIHNSLGAMGIKSDVVLVSLNNYYVEEEVKSLISTMEARDISHAYTKMMSLKCYSVNNCIGHVCVRVDGVLYDAEGINHDVAISKPIHTKVLEKMCNDINIWNEAFLDSNGKVTVNFEVETKKLRKLNIEVAKHVSRLIEI